MNLNKAVALLMFFSSFSFCLRAEKVWDKRTGGTKDDSGRDVEITSDNGYIVVGNTESFGAGMDDIYVLKFDKDGNQQWTKTFGGALRDNAYSIAKTNDGNFMIAGATESWGAGYFDVYLLKIKENGDTLWAKTFGGGGNDIPREIQKTSDGGFIIAGLADVSGKGTEGFLTKLTADGNVQWTKYYGGTKDDKLYSVKQTADGGFIALGQTMSYGNSPDVYMVKTDVGGNEQWHKVLGEDLKEEEGQFIQISKDGGYIFCADQNEDGEENYDVWVAMTDASGNIKWSKTFGGEAKDVVKMIVPINGGNTWLVGAITRSFGLVNPDMYLIKLDSNGNTYWTQTFGYDFHEHCYGVRVDPSGGYIAVGHSDNGGNLLDVYLVKLTDKLNGIAESMNIDQSINIYPNPASENMYISLTEPGFDLIQVVDMQGKMIYQENLIGNTSSLNIKGLAKGAYFLQISGKGKADRKTFIVN